MKKLLAILLAGVLTIGASMTAFAAPSPETNSQSTAITATSDAGRVIVDQNYQTEADKAAADEIRKSPTTVLESVVGADAAKDMSFVSVQDVRIEGNYELPVTITFQIPGVTASSKVIVLHYTEGAWKQETATIGQGTVTVTFTTLSPVAFFVDNSTAAAISKTSPKTGESPIMPMVILIAGVAAAGMTLSVKRKNA